MTYARQSTRQSSIQPIRKVNRKSTVVWLYHLICDTFFAAIDLHSCLIQFGIAISLDSHWSAYKKKLSSLLRYLGLFDLESDQEQACQDYSFRYSVLSTVLPCWVSNFCKLNANTVSDRHPLSKVNVILTDAACGKYWSKLNMTNVFFHTHLDEASIPQLIPCLDCMSGLLCLRA